MKRPVLLIFSAALIPMASATEGLRLQGQDLSSCEHVLQQESWQPPAPTPLSKTPGTIKLLRTLWKNPLEAWTKTYFEQPIVKTNLPGIRATVVNSPTAIRHVLMDNRANYQKDSLQKRIMTHALSNGLLMSEGEQWRNQRRTLAPIFNHRTVVSFAPAMLAATDKLAAEWGKSPDGTVHDVAEDVMGLMFDVLERTIFSEAFGEDAQEVRSAMRQYFDAIAHIDPFDVLGLPEAIPRLTRLRVASTVRFFDQTVDKIIANRRQRLQQDPANVPDDILTLLLKAGTENALTEPEIKSNIMTFIAAGSESTATAIMWTLYTLSQSQYWSDRIVTEARREFAGPEEDLASRLVETRAAVEETIRLYPPIAAISRVALEADDLDGCRVEPGEMVVISPYLLHRHQTLWDRPNEFDPSRFIGRSRESVDRFAYLPFGAGPRVCIGSPMALQSATLVVASIMKNFRLQVAPDHKVWPVLRVVLRPEGGLPMAVYRRD